MHGDGSGHEVINVSSGQHAHLIRPFTEAFGVTIDRDLEVGRPDQTATDVCVAVLERFDALLAELEPDLVIVQGDTTTALAGALAAFHRRVPVGHVEAGLRSGNPSSPFPEEMNRRLVTRVAALHFAATERNVEVLRAEGVDEDAILRTGNPVVDSVRWAAENTEPSVPIRELLATLDGKRIVPVTTHRRESFGDVMIERLRVLSKFAADREDVAIVFPVHPNPNVRRAVEEAMPPTERVHLIEPLGYLDFVHLMASAWMIVSDSGGVQEEAPTLGKPVLVIRENTERPEAIEAGVARLVGTSAESLASMLEEHHADPSWVERVRSIDNPFGTPGSAERIARAASDYVTGSRSARA